MNLARLPVSNQPFRFRPLTGADEMLLWSSGLSPDGLMNTGAELDLAVTLLERTALTDRGGALDIAALPVTDLDTLLLRFRASLFGEKVQAESTCPQPDCGARMDVAFEISPYLESQAPETPRGVSFCPQCSRVCSSKRRTQRVASSRTAGGGREVQS